MKSERTVTLLLSRLDRELLLKHGYPFPRLERDLEAVPDSVEVARIDADRSEVERLLGDLAHSINHCADRRLQLALNELFEEIEEESGL